MGLHWVPGVVRRDTADGVALAVECRVHGEASTVLCSDSEFWGRAVGAGNEPSDVAEGDIEDVLSGMGRTPYPTFPLMVEVVMHRGAEGLLSEDELKKMGLRIKSLFPPDLSFVLCLSAKRAPDLSALNQRVKYVASDVVPECIVIVELSFERLLILSRLQDSALLLPSVYPSLQFYLDPGGEDNCLTQLNTVTRELRHITGMQMVLNLMLDTPYAPLGKIVERVRELDGLVRALVFTLERRPSAVTRAVQGGQPGPVGTDVSAFLKHLEKEMGVMPGDFISVGACWMVLEPLLALLGYGSMSLRPAPQCVWACVLVCTESYRSVPLGRFIDLDRLMAEARPVMASDSARPRLLARLRTIVERCKKIDVPDVLAYLMDPQKAAAAATVLQHLQARRSLCAADHTMQVVLVHATMDIGQVDLERRRRCAVLSLSGADKGLVSQCLGCL